MARGQGFPRRFAPCPGQRQKLLMVAFVDARLRLDVSFIKSWLASLLPVRIPLFTKQKQIRQP